MTTQSTDLITATAIYGTASGRRADIASGEPRLVLDLEDGTRIYASFTPGINVDAAASYRFFVHNAAHRMDRESIARLADSLLAVLPAEERATVIAGVCDRFHTPGVLLVRESVA